MVKLGGMLMQPSWQPAPTEDRATRTVAALEAATLAGGGVLVGVVAFLAPRPLLQNVDAAWREWFSGRPLDPYWWGWLAGTAGVLALSLLVALAPSREVTRSPLATSSGTPP